MKPEERPSRIEDLIGRALMLGVFRLCMPVDIFETGHWLAEHEQFPESLGLELAADFAASDNPYARFRFAYALERYARSGGGGSEVIEAARLFGNDTDPYARKHARAALALLGTAE